MKLEWLISDVIALEFLARAESDIFWVILDNFVNSGRYCGRGASL